MTRLTTLATTVICIACIAGYPNSAEADFWKKFKKQVSRTLKDFKKGVTDVAKTTAKLNGINVAAKLVAVIHLRR